jgi:hypothetical protein
MNTNQPFISPPKLIEPGVRYFLSGTLKECRKFKDTHSTFFFNFYMTCVLVLLIGGFLYFRYRGKLTPAEIELKNRKKKEYIISKLHQIAYIRKSQGGGPHMITDLPQW